jgi:hypothetical protein
MMVGRTFIPMFAAGFIAAIAISAAAAADGQSVRQLAQYNSRSFDSRPANGPPTPAPRSSSGATTVLPRVPYDNRLDSQRRFYRDAYPNRTPRRTPESQRVVPNAPQAGGDPQRFFDPPAQNSLSCETLRRLATRTGRLYWTTRYRRCIGVD